MPALDEKSYARFNQMLEELAPEVDNMKDVPKGFMSDMIQKNNEYGERVFVSPKQLAWIEKLHEEFVGDTDQSAESGEVGDRGMDDDIPF